MSHIVKTYPAQTREATCQDCPAEWHALNAMGAAAKHAATYGHTVEGYSSTHFRYAPRADEAPEGPYGPDEDAYGYLYEERAE